jgi:hypothetical protein
MTDQDKGPTLARVLASVLASMFGVQSNKQREQDFTHGKAGTYIAVGIVATLVFILAIWGVVQLVVRIAAQ